ncbi:MAG TPA: endo-1,4-beta-xylanase [Gemmatimonadaceae bacterium]
MSLRRTSGRLVAALAETMLLASCGRLQRTFGATPALKDVFSGAFLVGAAISEGQLIRDDRGALKLVRKHYNSISPENMLKWEVVHPLPHTYDFSAADRYVSFGERNGMFIVGHPLVWHSQTPAWVFADSSGQPLGRDSLLARMRDHILTVVGRYRGRIKGWDVVNEALADDGTLRDSPWRRIIGDDYIELAFRYAHEADPGAELYYNDYSLENPAKRAGAVRLILGLRAQGVPITAVGMQEHNRMEQPTSEQVDTTITVLSGTGVRVAITELDVDVLPLAFTSGGADVGTRATAAPRLNPWTKRLPDPVQHALADRYGDLFRVYWRHRDVIDRVTFWGVRDRDSWLNDWPVAGRTNYPLLFDRNGQPKPAFTAVVRVAR